MEKASDKTPWKKEKKKEMEEKGGEEEEGREWESSRNYFTK